MKMKFISFLLIIGLLQFTGLKADDFVVFHHTFYFASSKYQVTQKHREELEQILRDSLRNIPQAYKVRLEGYTDNTGSIEYNKVLAKKRTQSIEQLLLSKGFQSVLTRASNDDYLKPKASNKTEYGKAKNRRVELFLLSNHLSSQEAFNYEENPQEVTFKSTDSLTFLSDFSASKVKIPANAFNDKDGNNYQGTIRVVYNEYREPADFVLSDISMMKFDDDVLKPFNSGGMFAINAFDEEGRELQLKSDKKIEVDFDMVQDLPNMKFWSYDSVVTDWDQEEDLTHNPIPQVEPVVFYSYFEDGVERVKCDIQSCNVTKRVYKQCWKWIREHHISMGIVNSVEQKTRQGLQAQIYEVKKEAIKPNYKIKSKGAQSFKVKVRGFAQLERYRFETSDTLSNSVFKKWRYLDLEHVAGNRFVMHLYFNGDRRKIACSVKGEKSNKNIATEMLEALDEAYSKANSKVMEEVSNQEKVEDGRLVQSSLIVANDRLIKQVEDSLACFYTLNQILMQGDYERSLNDEDWKTYFLENIDFMLSRFNQIEAMGVKVCDLQEYMDLKRCTGQDFSFDEYLVNKSKLQEICSQKSAYALLDPEVKSAYSFEDYIDNKDSLEVLSDRLNALQDIGVEVSLKDVQSENGKYERAKKKFDKYLDRMTSDDLIRQKFALDGMGVYNCDQIDRIKSPMYVKPVYQDESGNKIEIVKVEIIDSEINGLIAYEGYVGYGPYYFAFGKNSTNRMIAYDKYNNPYFCNDDQFKAVKKVNTVFVLNKLDIEGQKAKLKETLNL